MSAIVIGQQSMDSPSTSDEQSRYLGYNPPPTFTYGNKMPLDPPPLIFTAVEKSQDPDEVQFGGDHYKKMAIQPTDYIVANNMGFCEGNVIKYVSRHRNKGGAEDLRKAIHYLQLLLKHEYGTQ